MGCTGGNKCFCFHFKLKVRGRVGDKKLVSGKETRYFNYSNIKINYNNRSSSVK